jgi:formylglycine-generating enzyme required for sulfatase activity
MSNSDSRVLRGGSYYFGPEDLNVTNRFWITPESRIRIYGFRLVIRRKK